MTRHLCRLHRSCAVGVSAVRLRPGDVQKQRDCRSLVGMMLDERPTAAADPAPFPYQAHAAEQVELELHEMKSLHVVLWVDPPELQLHKEPRADAGRWHSMACPFYGSTYEAL